MTSRIYELRQELGLTQRQLAERAGVAQACVSRLENGNRAGTVGTRFRVAAALEHSVRDVFPGVFEETGRGAA